MAWTDEMVDQLRQMWKEGLTTGEIGKRLGVSKNSIVGKVHRLGLSGRPSPIKKKEDSESAPKKENLKENNEKKSASKPQPAAEAKPKAEKKVAEKTPVETSDNVSEQSLGAAPFASEMRKHHGKTMLTDLDNHTCRWPIGDPKDENFHFCGRKVHIGQTYCDEHAAIAYVKAAKK